MVTARRVGKWALYAGGGVLALVVVARVGLGIYLSTAAGKEMVARRIADQIGMPVEVTAVRVGLATSSIGMRVFDPAAPDPKRAEVFSVEEARADVSLFGLAFGRLNPDWVDLRGANLTLHVGADGDVITTLPKAPTGGGGGGGSFPVIRLTDARLTVRQDGRPEFAFRNFTLTAEPAGDSVKLTGAIDDPEWGKWAVTGDINRVLKTGAVVLATENGPLTMDRLGSVPFVPPSVWESVRPDGRGAIAVKMWAGPDREVQYSVDITPAAAALTLPDASITLERVTGLIRVTGAKVELVGTKAAVAGGNIAIDGSLDFGPEPTVMNLKVAGRGLDIRKLPPEWNLPKLFEGRLGGTANLVIRIHSDGRVEYDGGGDGAITGVKVLDVPQDDIPIRLRQRGNRYEFQRDEPAPKASDGRSRAVAREPVRCAAPRQEKKPADAGKKDPPEKDDDGPTTLDATVRFRDIDVAELLDKLNVKLGYKVAGKITVEAVLAVPLGQAASLSAYQFTGSLSSPALTFEGLTVRAASAKMTYRDGKLTLTDLSGQIDQPGNTPGPPGSFRGTATAAVSPPGDATATLTVDRVPLGEALKAVPGFAADIRGTVSGKLSLKAPYEKLWDTTVWSGSADLSAPELVVEGRTAKDVRAKGTVAKGVLTISDAAVTVEGIPVTAEATVNLSDKYAFAAVVRTTGTDVTDLRRLVPEVEIPAPISGVLETETKVTGTASPLTFRAVGKIKALKLTLGKSTANQVTAAWELTEERLAITELKAEAFGGTLSGSADVPFDRAKAGKFEVAFKDLDAAGATELVPDFPVRIAGKVSGRVGGAIPPAKPGQARVGNLDLELTAPRLTVQGIPAEKLVGTASYEAGVVKYSLEGKTLGGSFEITGRYPGKKKDDKAPGPERGSLRVTGVDLARIARDVGIPTLAPLRGRVDANFTFDDDLSAGSGRVVLTGLKWGDTLVSRELTGVLILREGRLELSDVGGAVAGGFVRARASVRLDDTSRNFFSVTVTGADAKRLLAPLGASAVDVDGPVNVVVRGRVGRETRASGSIALPRGTVAGAQVTDLRVPFEFASVRGGFGRLTVREAMAQAGSGRARADLTVEFGFETKVDALVTFVDVPLRTVVPGLGENGLFGNGRITGRFDLAGRNVRTADDLTGTLNATLNQTSVREIPLLRQVTPFLNPSGLTKPFDAGDVRARLSGGVFRVERLALANPGAQLYAEGTVSLAGRVDLDVVAHTGPAGPDAGGLRLFIRRLPLFGPIPVGLIRDVTTFLSNRTVRLTVTGTTANPVVRVNLGALLTEEAVRFFLTRYVLPGGAGGVLAGSVGGDMRR